ncbi:MAG: hypothetical protein ACREKH_15810 [Candidatus Rokuibacteriota bacterium]
MLNDWGAYLGARDILVGRIVGAMLAVVSVVIAWFNYPGDSETAQAYAILAVICAGIALRPSGATVSRIVFGILSLVSAALAGSKYPDDTKAHVVLAIICACVALRPPWRRTAS